MVAQILCCICVKIIIVFACTCHKNTWQIQNKARWRLANRCQRLPSMVRKDGAETGADKAMQHMESRWMPTLLHRLVTVTLGLTGRMLGVFCVRLKRKRCEKSDFQFTSFLKGVSSSSPSGLAEIWGGGMPEVATDAYCRWACVCLWEELSQIPGKKPTD